jgi:hypothetical protein
MKKKLSKRLFVFPLWGLGGLLLATSCATISTTNKTATGVATAPVYYTGNNEPAASGMFVYSGKN